MMMVADENGLQKMIDSFRGLAQTISTSINQMDVIPGATNIQKDQQPEICDIISKVSIPCPSPQISCPR